MKEVEDGFLAGKNQYKFMRAFFGLSACFTIGIISGFATKGRPLDELRGLVWGTINDAIKNFYGGRRGVDDESAWNPASVQHLDEDPTDEKTQLPLIRVSAGLAKAVDAEAGDILYMSDARWWLGGLRSGHARIGSIDNEDNGLTVHLGPNTRSRIIVNGREATPLQVKRLY